MYIVQLVAGTDDILLRHFDNEDDAEQYAIRIAEKGWPSLRQVLRHVDWQSLDITHVLELRVYHCEPDGRFRVVACENWDH